LKKYCWLSMSLTLPWNWVLDVWHWCPALADDVLNYHGDNDYAMEPPYSEWWGFGSVWHHVGALEQQWRGIRQWCRRPLVSQMIQRRFVLRD
jgi:hypothetical protein